MPKLDVIFKKEIYVKMEIDIENPNKFASEKLALSSKEIENFISNQIHVSNGWKLKSIHDPADASNSMYLALLPTNKE